MNAREVLRGKEAQYAAESCCAVPLDRESPTCPWHGYRSLMVSLAAHDLPEEMCAQALTVETSAMVHVLEFMRTTIVADAQSEAARGYAPMEITAKLVHRLNHLIQQIKR